MKIYLFDPETAVYLGEDFADEAPPRGEYVTPIGATTVAPPAVNRGEILLYSVAEQRWVVRSPRVDGEN